MEKSFLLCKSYWYWWHWRDRRGADLPKSGRPLVSSGIYYVHGVSLGLSIPSADNFAVLIFTLDATCLFLSLLEFSRFTSIGETSKLIGVSVFSWRIQISASRSESRISRLRVAASSFWTTYVKFLYCLLVCFEIKVLRKPMNV